MSSLVFLCRLLEASKLEVRFAMGAACSKRAVEIAEVPIVKISKVPAFVNKHVFVSKDLRGTVWRCGNGESPLKC